MTQQPLSFIDHFSVLLSGAVGGYIGFFLLALFVFHTPFRDVGLDSYPCWGIGLVTGYPPGIMAILGSRRRWVGVCTALGCGAFYTALVTVVLGAGASC